MGNPFLFLIFKLSQKLLHKHTEKSYACLKWIMQSYFINQYSDLDQKWHSYLWLKAQMNIKMKKYRSFYFTLILSSLSNLHLNFLPRTYYLRPLILQKYWRLLMNQTKLSSQTSFIDLSLSPKQSLEKPKKLWSTWKRLKIKLLPSAESARQMKEKSSFTMNFFFLLVKYLWISMEEKEEKARKSWNGKSTG